MLLNAFSMNMLADFPASIRVTEISVAEARHHLLALAEEAGEAELIQSAVGHADTAAVFSRELNLPVPVNRATVALQSGDRVIVGQYSGPRLPEGATELPEGATIKWLAVSIT